MVVSPTPRTAPVAAPPAATARQPPRWPYAWGRIFRVLGPPFDLHYGVAVNRTIVLGAEHLAGLPTPVIFAGTHHGFGDVPLRRRGLARADPAPIAAHSHRGGATRTRPPGLR